MIIRTLATLTLAVATLSDAQPVTVAESSGYQRTGRDADVRAFLAELEDRDALTLSTLGTTTEGREIQLAIVADPPVGSAEQARGDKRTTVLLFGNIHAGETCGKEALQMLARELSDPEHPSHGLLENLIVAIVPNYNADGNERFDASNRPGQDGPEEMGTRRNAMGLDLNRDYVKMEAPETRALVRFLNEWDPAIVVDTHTTNGSRHRYTMTYQGPKHPAGDAEVIEYVRDTMLPAIDESVTNRTDYEFFFYGNFNRAHTRWTTYPAEPRYGVGYRGMRNRVSILTEAYSYATFEDRVLSTLEFSRGVLEYASENGAEIAKLIRDADRRTIEHGENAEGELVLRAEARAFEAKEDVLGFEFEIVEGQRRPEYGDETTHEVDIINLFVPTLTVDRPFAYAMPASLTDIAQHLQLHGVEVEVLREEIDVDIETYRLGGVTRSPREFEGHNMVIGLETAATPTTRRLEPGTYIVRMGQELGTLAGYMLEPQASDGLVAWNFFDAFLSDADGSAEFPVVRIPEPTALLTRDVRPLPEDREMNRRITYDNLYGDDRVSLGGSPTRVSRWVDDDHFLQRKEGDLFKVHAGTGRGEKVSFDPSDIAAKLAELPALTKRDATQIARRWFNNPVPPEAEEDGRVRPIVFEFADDLYAAMPDGTEAKRLTSTPEDEDLWELSPDGRWVGFVRDFNLYVVDIATAGERAITTGGHDELRYGRHDWVYFEELYGRSWKAWWWGPDSRHLAFFETASDMMPSFTIVDDGPEPQRIETVRYPKPGQANPQVKVHVAKVSGARPTEVDLGWYDDGAYLVSGLSWRPDGSEVRVIVQNRQQTWLDVLAAKTSSGATRRLFRDQTEAWIEPNGGVVDLDAGGFLWRSERDGYLHVYRYDDDGELLGRLTEGPFEVDRIVRVDEENGFLYFTSELDSPIGSHFYRVAIGEPDDEGSVTPSEPQRLTPDRGTHFVSLSPDATKFVDSWSSTEQPTMVALRSTNGGVAMRWLDTNPVYELEEFDLGRTELVAIPSEKFDHNGDPIEFEGVIVYPPDFDPSKTYPVWFRTYGGPHAPTVRDSWSGGRLFEQMLAAEGIVVFRGDPYPASGKGVVSTWSAYRNLGIREVEDVAEMIEWITANGWADASRVGMDGWSYGGFMTLACMLRTDLFSAGISGAPPTNWRDYDTIYTERYMDTPQNNPDGYEATDLVKLAEDLHGELLLIHGMMDDNVHMQNSVRMIDALQDAGKNFEFMMYPGARHGVRSRHRNLLYFNFVTRTMLGDREESEPESLADEIESPVGP